MERAEDSAVGNFNDSNPKKRRRTISEPHHHLPSVFREPSTVSGMPEAQNRLEPKVSTAMVTIHQKKQALSLAVKKIWRHGQRWLSGKNLILRGTITTLVSSIIPIYMCVYTIYIFVHKFVNSLQPNNKPDPTCAFPFTMAQKVVSCVDHKSFLVSSCFFFGFLVLQC